MNSSLIKPRSSLHTARSHRARPYLICAALLALPFLSQAQSDNFDSGSDAAWAKITSPNYPATYSFPADDFGGHAYRLQGAATPGGTGGRVVAYRTDRTYTNFFISVDIVSWDSSSTNDQVFGLLARADSITSGDLNGATFTVRINRYTNANDPNDNSPKGQAQIYSFFFGGVGAPAAQNFFTTLVPGHKYRFTFTGVANSYSAAIYDLEDLTYPLVTMSGDDSAAASTYPSSGYVGIFNYSLASSPKDLRTDTTFDNFVAMELPPTSVPAPGTPHGLTGAPQVVNRVPASYANFHPSSSGISFNATTLTTTNSIDAASIKLYLNELNVSPALSVSGPATNLLVTYNGLTSNALYDARIELSDVLGRHITNRFTFDTFVDSYLAAAPAKNIECEDYDFSDAVNDGLFIDNPLPSGLTTNGSPINAGSSSYYEKEGLNAKGGGLDFYTPDGAADVNWSDFRSTDDIRTLQGSRSFAYYLGGTLFYDRSYDTQRKKYSSADPALEEYNVVQTRGGIWMNYTRVFPTNSYYFVYLRHGSAFAQQLRLDQVATGPVTNKLGTFNAVNGLQYSNYRYVPLRDDSNNLAVVSLSGTNSLRLNILGTTNAPDADSNSLRYGLNLNYLALVPALLVESAASISGPWSIESTASVEPGTRHISIPQNGTIRFYRLRWDHAARLLGLRLSGGVVDLTYQ